MPYTYPVFSSWYYFQVATAHETFYSVQLVGDGHMGDC